MAKVNANHIASAQGGGTPQGANHWAIEIEGLGGGGAEVIVLALDSSNAPQETQEELELKYGNETRYYAGGVTFESMSLTVRDFIDMDVVDILEAWRNQAYDPETGNVGYPSEYKKSAHFIMLDSKGIETRRWELEGVWCSALNRGAVSMDDAAVVKVEATIRYDKMLRPTA